MVFGADVTHPTSFDPSDPSIAAVTGSYDATLGRYMARVLKQVREREGGDGLGSWGTCDGGKECSGQVRPALRIFVSYMLHYELCWVSHGWL